METEWLDGVGDLLAGAFLDGEYEEGQQAGKTFKGAQF